MPSRTFDRVIPEPESFLQSLRAFGYSLETAVSDLIDNSITAGANKIWISINIEKFNIYVRIEDNGRGMSQSELVNAMKIGSFNPLDMRKPEDLGRFGLGLKTASFSQCTRLSVRSFQKGKSNTRIWDLDIINIKKDWILLKKCVSDQSEANLGSLSSVGSGTIVLLENLDRLAESGDFTIDKENLNRKTEALRIHLGLIFHRFIEDKNIVIFLNNKKIRPVNPFFASDHQLTRQLSEETHVINGSTVIIQPYILPHESKLSKDDMEALGMLKGWNEHQGIYLYRNKRLILEGSWLDLPFYKKESQRLVRIQIDIANTLDKEWKIDVKKASAKVPDVLRTQLKRITTSAILEGIRVYTHRGAYVRRKNQKKEIIYLWVARQKKGKRYYTLNVNHPIYQLIEDLLEENKIVFRDFSKLISETIPVSLIVDDFSGSNQILKEFFEDEEKELLRIYQNMVTALVNIGLTEEEAVEKIKSLESFQNIT